MVVEQGVGIFGNERHEWEMKSGSISSSPRGQLESSICECSLIWQSCRWSRGEAKDRSVRCEMCDGATAATAS